MFYEPAGFQKDDGTPGPDIADVQADWIAVAPEMGYSADPDGALTFINDVVAKQSGGSVAPAVAAAAAPGTSTAGPAASAPTTSASPPAVAPTPAPPRWQQARDAVMGLTYTGRKAPSRAFPGEKYHISIYSDGADMWKYKNLFFAAATDDVEILASSLFPERNGAGIVFYGPSVGIATANWLKTTEANFGSFDELEDAEAAFSAAAAVFDTAAAKNESLLKRWNKLAGLLVD
jgi:hypothetical protein